MMPPRVMAAARPYLYLFPTLVVLGAFVYFPIARLAEMSLHAPGFGTSLGPWIGLSAYAKLFANPLFWRVLEQTLLFVFASVPIAMTLALGLALLLDQPLRGVGVFRVFYYTPVVMPTVAVAALALWMFNANGGIVDYLLRAAGIAPIPWLIEGTWALPTLVLIAIWKNVGYYMIIYL